MKETIGIVIVSAVFPPEPLASARMSHDLAIYMADAGHSITVLCPSPSRPLNVDYSQYSNESSDILDMRRSLEVKRLPSFTSPKSKLFARLLESYSFGREVRKYLVGAACKPDVIYVNAWPLVAQFIIARYVRKYSVPMVLQIMDVYPEAFTDRLPWLLRVVLERSLRIFDTWTAKSAKIVVVISESMRRAYCEKRGVSLQSILNLPTWQDPIVFENTIPRSACCSRFGVSPAPFTFLFLGNIGPVAGVVFLINAFSQACIPNTQLLIIGDGVGKSECIKLAKRLNLTNVYFISDPNVSNVPILQSMAHVCMLPMRPGRGASSIPSKLPSYLFSAKPIIATVDLNSDTAQFIRNGDCGWVGEPEDLSWLVEKMKEVSCLPEDVLNSIGRRGREYGLANFSKANGVARLAEAVLTAAVE